MLSDFLKAHIKSQASFVEWGYGQVEPNHLSAQRNGQIYAQLPAAADIDVLEQGQFVKYDYANDVVNFEGPGEWMLVYNEIKLYRDHQDDCEFAMLEDNYQARLYSVMDGDTNFNAQSRFLNGKDAAGAESITLNGTEYKFDDVTAAPDMYELHYNEDPFHIESKSSPRRMPLGTTMVPRVFKTMPGDIMTTNTIHLEKGETLKVGNMLTPGANGILKIGEGDMQWQVVKIYTMPDHQRGAKIMRVK